MKWTRNRWSAVGMRLAILAGGLAVGLLISEITLRLALPILPTKVQDQFGSVAPGFRQSQAAVTSLHEADPQLGYKMRASMSSEIRLRSELPPTRITTNELGFRGPPPKDAPVLVVGDSFAFGYGVDDEETSASRLGRLLGVKVACLCVTGYNPYQYNRNLYEHGLPNAPKLVLYYLFLGNDFGGKQLLDDEPVPPRARREWRNRLHTMLSANSVVYQLAKAFMGARVYKYGRHVQTEDLDLYFYLYNVNYSLEQRKKSRNVEIVAENLRRARERSRLARAEMVVVLIPTKESVYRHLAESETPSPEFFAAEDELRRRAIASIASQGGRYLDLTPALQRRATQGEQLYHVFDAHWNAAGNGAVAEEIHTYLREEKLLSSGTGG